jgi:3-oxoacyl-[acyl-carrier protein] reductase
VKHALVTAAGQGLGAAIAAHLERAGHRVLAHHLTSPPSAGTPIRADLSTPAGRIALIDAVRASTPRLDVLVNNLGVYPEDRRLLDIDIEAFRSILELSLTAAHHLTQLAVELLGEGSRVINIGDSGADRIEARVRATPYHIAKIGLHVSTRSFAEVLMPRGITVNMVSPGFLENSVGSPGSALPAGRKGRFEDVLGAVDYLLSEGAAYVSGTNLVVAGGWNL